MGILWYPLGIKGIFMKVVLFMECNALRGGRRVEGFPGFVACPQLHLGGRYSSKAALHPHFVK
jgi:hypothetical protein